MKTTAELEREILALAPWALEVPVTPEVNTRIAEQAQREASGSARPVDIVDVGPRWRSLLSTLYPDGFANRSVLDVGCNCGAYMFWAREQGAGECLGIDVREHWLRQAEFLAEHGPWDTEGMRFELMDLYDLPATGYGPFDVTFFLGIFYHLPDPLAALKIAAEATRGILILDTATKTGLPDGTLYAEPESKVAPLSGVYGLSWRPTGPEVMTQIFRWLGFNEVRVVSNRKSPASRGADRGRMRIVAARDASLLADYDRLSASRRAVAKA